MEERMKQYENLELSTQLVIREALKRNAKVEILDRKDNFVRIVKDRVSVLIKQATMTATDSYITVLVMENKTVTKTLLREAGLRVPLGYEISDLNQLRLPMDGECLAGGLAVKPKSTNFGIGVTILNAGYSAGDLRDAAKHALKFDSSAIVEEKIEGTELRFLVIGGKVRAVLERVPAHVIGDGRSTIHSLVRQKNSDPRRGSGYRFPMEKIRLGPVEKAQLAEAGLKIYSIPNSGQRISLRKNSNISTGGEGIDRTGDVHSFYNAIAVRAVETVGASICGVDLIASDFTKKPNQVNYGIIELNFNPALHIHDFPAVGKNRQVETFVLDLLNIK